MKLKENDGIKQQSSLSSATEGKWWYQRAKALYSCAMSHLIVQRRGNGSSRKHRIATSSCIHILNKNTHYISYLKLHLLSIVIVRTKSHLRPCVTKHCNVA